MKKPTVRQVIAKAKFVCMNSIHLPSTGFTVSKKELLRQVERIDKEHWGGGWKGKVVMLTANPNIAVVTDKKGNEPDHPDFEGNAMFAHLFTLNAHGFISINTDNSFWNDYCQGKEGK